VSPVKYELCYIPEDGVLHSDCRENLKSYRENSFPNRYSYSAPQIYLADNRSPYGLSYPANYFDILKLVDILNILSEAYNRDEVFPYSAVKRITSSQPKEAIWLALDVT
jgi:hypothetical protein